MKNPNDAPLSVQGQLGTANSLSCLTQTPLQDKTHSFKESAASNAADYVIVPGTVDTKVTERFTWFYREALYNNEAGVYLTDEQGRVNGIAPSDPGYAEAVLTSPTHKTLFTSGQHPLVTTEATFNGGDRLSFYIIQNNTSEAWLNANPQNTIGKGKPLAFFSVTDANADHFDHTHSTARSDGNWQINWEDLTYGGDKDFDDVVFKIEPIAIETLQKPQLSIGDVSVTEGDAGFTPAQFTATLSAAATTPVTVSYTTADGTAKAGTDYQASSGQLTFNPGETSKTIVVPIGGDLLLGADRTFSITLSEPLNALLTKAQATGTIVDNDTAAFASTVNQVGALSSTLKSELDQLDANLALFKTELANAQTEFAQALQTGANQPPSIISIPQTQAVAGQLYQYTVQVQDADGDPITFGLDKAPNGMTIDPKTGVVSYNPTANTTTLVFDTSQNPFTPGINNQGFWSATYPIDGYSSYTVGEPFWIASNLPTGDVINGYWTFDLSSLTAPITSATLEVQRYYGSGDPTETLGLFSVETDAATLNNRIGTNSAIFNDLGSGTSYGTYAVSTTGDPTEILGFNLNTAAIAAINKAKGGFFSIGNTILSLDRPNSQSPEYLFALVELASSSGVPRLVLETSGQQDVVITASDGRGGETTQQYTLNVTENASGVSSSQGATTIVQNNSPRSSSFLTNLFKESINTGLTQSQAAAAEVTTLAQKLHTAQQNLDEITALDQKVLATTAGDNSSGATFLRGLAQYVLDRAVSDTSSLTQDLTAAQAKLTTATTALDAVKARVNSYVTPLPSATNTFNFPVSNQPLVGVIDTGFAQNNPDIDYSRIIAGKDLVDGDANPFLTPGQGNEHGTAVLGVIAATRGNNLGIDGINDKAPVWVGRAVGSGNWAASLTEFVDAAKAANKPNAIALLAFDLTQTNPDGSVTTRDKLTQEEVDALTYARNNHILVVVAAGNQNGALSALGQASQWFDNVVTVGAATGTNKASYSSFGQGLTLVATGGDGASPVLSTVGNDVGVMDGTSIAAAEVAGAVSEVWAANPTLNYQQIISILKNTATDLGDSGYDPQTGAGLLNLNAAVTQAMLTTPLQATSTATAPAPVLNTANLPKSSLMERAANENLALRNVLPIEAAYKLGEGLAVLFAGIAAILQTPHIPNDVKDNPIAEGDPIPSPGSSGGSSNGGGSGGNGGSGSNTGSPGDLPPQDPNEQGKQICEKIKPYIDAIQEGRLDRVTGWNTIDSLFTYFRGQGYSEAGLNAARQQCGQYAFPDSTGKEPLQKEYEYFVELMKNIGNQR
ncbi:MAG: S8 family serine peptidase [Stenomitos rutilans HA7619-LM2]|jgi:hypothetical protein|nr:S8 family serine peptidase [Stenomitos rutilans HA7619-LM2]